MEIFYLHLKDYRIRFKIHKGETHEWNKLDNNLLQKMIFFMASQYQK